MRLEFDLNNNVEKPEIILGKRNYDKFGSIVHFDNLAYEYNLISANSVSFTVYQELNGEKERLWNEIRNGRLVWLKEFNEWFEIEVTVNEDSGIAKEVTGTALCEAELSQIMIRGAEINTEDDIARDEYINPTVFYKPSNPKESLLHRLLKGVPNYSIKHVDETLWNIQRTFSIDGSTVYDVLMNEIAEEIGCLFLFDSTDRSISVYDLKTNCQNCGHRADYTDICPECGSKNLNYGYGCDTTIFVDSETLAQNISLTGKQDEVKNYIRVSGGDDMMNAAIAACNPSGTQYIFTFSKADKEDMSEMLSAKLEEYQKEFDRLTPNYQSIMKDLYNAVDEQLSLESGMMPDIKTAQTTAAKELAKLTSANLSPVAVTDVSTASVYTVNNAVLGMAKCMVNSTVYKISLTEGSTSLTSQTWRGKFRLVNRNNEEDSAENTGFITVTVNDDYAYYVKQKIQKTIDRDDIYLVDIFDMKTDLDVFRAELKKYCLNRLTSFESAYQSVIDVLIEANCANYSAYGDIYNALYLPYYKKLTAIQKEIKIRGEEIKAVEERLSELEKVQAEITEYLNPEHYLGESLWKELCSFRREDSFENSSYISDGLDNTELLEKAQELLEKAKTEAVTASTLQMSLSTGMFNLLAIPEFKKLTGMFEGGNWIRVKVDNKIYRLRLVHYKIDFSEIQNIEVEFSDVTETANGMNDVKSLMDKVQSISSGFPYVAHQAEQGSKGFAELDKIRNNGLDAALYRITNSSNQEFVIDEHGVTGRQWDDILGDYSPEQVKWINNLLVYTDDYWNTAKAALGKIQYYDPIRKAWMEKYGLIAEAVISGILMSNDIIGGHIYSENYSKTSGTHINLNNGDFSFAGGKLVYDSEKNTLNLTGKITFEAIDYKDDETMKSVKDSLGVTQVENDIDEFNNASILTPLEKKDMADDWKVIQEEYKKNLALAEALGIGKHTKTASYMEAYKNLADEIEKCGLNDLTSSTALTNTNIYECLNNYHSCNVELNLLFNETVKSFTEKQIASLKTSMEKEVGELNTSLGNLNSYVDGAFKDGVLDESEAATIKSLIRNLEAEKTDVDAEYQSVNANSLLSKTCKADLEKAKTEFDSAHNSLISKINTAVEKLQSPTATAAQKQTAVSDMDAAFNLYNTRLSALRSALENAVESIGDGRLNHFISGEYADMVKDIQGQIDGKSDIYYQADMPHPEYKKIADNAAYNVWIGDLWYDSDAKSKRTYVYTKSSVTGTDNYNYEWKEMEVPAEIFDMADGKAQLFTKKPSSYNKNDMWLVGSDYIPKITGAKVGYLLIAGKDNTSYQESDWLLSVKYTDDTALNTFLTGDYADTVNEIRTQMDKKAETYWQADMPHPEKKNVPASKDLDDKTGDLWYNTKEKKSYRFTKVPSGSNYNYVWNEIDGVPDSVYDKIDGKKSVYTSLPSSYCTDDIYILETDRGSWKQGTILAAKKDGASSSFIAGDWKEPVRYTDDTVAMQAVSDGVLTPSEKRDLLNEINSIKASYTKHKSFLYQIYGCL